MERTLTTFDSSRMATGSSCTLWFSGVTTAEHRKVMDQFQTLYVAWRDGDFALGRYCAEKSANR